MFDASTVQSDVHRLWATGRFDDIRVETTPEGQGTAVVFRVVEVPQLLLHQLHVEPSTFGLQMNLPEGTPMSRLRAHQIANQAEQDLRSDGFRTATVDYDLVPYIGNKVDLHLNIEAGERVRVKAVEFVGDTAFDSKDLARRSPFTQNSSRDAAHPRDLERLGSISGLQSGRRAGRLDSAAVLLHIEGLL